MNAADFRSSARRGSELPLTEIRLKKGESVEKALRRLKKKIDREKIAAGVRLMLEGMGEDPSRDGLVKTPERVADFYAELTEGMWIDPKKHIEPLPGDSHDEMVLVKDISIASVCERATS